MKIKHIRPMQQRLRVSETLRGAELLRSHAARGNERKPERGWFRSPSLQARRAGVRPGHGRRLACNLS
ncbi:hypothetical protein, partial [Candidatus Thiosymbion oneisti]|uniref:hypothetical protein n=1 Tax=Candidatus Thiosymbion oneisti TaxID=589554 RepID=UPI001A9CA080